MANELVEKFTLTFAKGTAAVTITEKTFRTDHAARSKCLHRSVTLSTSSVGIDFGYLTEPCRGIWINRDPTNYVQFLGALETELVSLAPGECAVFRVAAGVEYQSDASTALLEYWLFED